MNVPKNRNRFIPFRKTDITEMCLSNGRLQAPDRQSFREFCRILESLLHFEFHRRLETLKDCYAPFNPDADTRSLIPYSADQKNAYQAQLVEALARILEAANFQKITPQDLQEALAEESLFKIRLAVDFDDFEEVIFYRRGESRKKEILVKFFGFKKTPIDFTNYDRVAIYIKFKEADYFENKKRKHLYFTPGATLIKLFQNVPKADLEMLFPNSEVRMKTIDKLIIGIPAAVSGAVVIATKLGATLLLLASLIAFYLGLSEKEVAIEQKHLVAVAVGLATLGAFVFKQVNKFKNRKIKFMKALADSLYFKNLDNNAGVFHHLIDAAEEEEFKEAVLAYYFLLTAGNNLTVDELDRVVETWLADVHDCRVDFEISDALAKLERLGLVDSAEGKLRYKGLDAAKAILDRTWDDYFAYAK